MMKPVSRVVGGHANPVEGQVKFDRAKATWNLSMTALGLFLAPLTASVGAITVFLALTYVTLLLGHSVGMHRFMIHRTFNGPQWLEKLLVYCGVLVGMAGPFGVIRIHDLRDWAQRRHQCHDFFAHKRGYLQDLCWQLTCSFEFAQAPELRIEKKFADDPWYKFLDRTWRWHQLVLAIPLYVLGGWSWVVWGVVLRVAVSNIGHWSITYLCHNPGPGHWIVKDASVQASDLPGLGFVSCGECWHSNHHAFPESARIGLEPGQTDPAWRVIQFLGSVGLAWNIGVPRPDQERDDLRRREPECEQIARQALVTAVTGHSDKAWDGRRWTVASDKSWE